MTTEEVAARLYSELQAISIKNDDGHQGEGRQKAARGQPEGSQKAGKGQQYKNEKNDKNDKKILEADKPPAQKHKPCAPDQEYDSASPTLSPLPPEGQITPTLYQHIQF